MGLPIAGASILTDVLIGGLYGTITSSSAIENREIEKGGHLEMTALNDWSNAAMAMDIANVGFGWNASMWCPQLILTAVVVLSNLGASFLDESVLKDICLLVLDNLTPISKIANIISMVAMFFFASPVMGGVCLSLYAISQIDHHVGLPKCIQTVYYYTINNSAVLTVASLFIASGLNLVLSAAYAAFQVYMFVTRQLCSDLSAPPSIPLTLDKRLSADNLVTILEFCPSLSTNILDSQEPKNLKTILCVDEESLRLTYPKYDGPCTDNINFVDILERTFEERKTDLNHLLLRKAQSSDHIRGLMTRNRLTKGGILEHLSAKFMEFLNRIENESLNGGVPLDYQRIKKQMRVIAHYIDSKLASEDRAQQIAGEDFLLDLVVEAGGYCDEKQVRIISKTYYKIILDQILADRSISPIDKIRVTMLFQLLEEREGVVQTTVASLPGVIKDSATVGQHAVDKKLADSPRRKVLAKLGIFAAEKYYEQCANLFANEHFFNAMMMIYGDPLGLPRTEAMESDVVASGTDMQLQAMVQNTMLNVFSWFMPTPEGQETPFNAQRIMKQMLYQKLYELDNLVARSIELIEGQDMQTYQAIGEWLRSWISASTFTAAQKQAMEERLLEDSYFVIYKENSTNQERISIPIDEQSIPTLIAAMLADFGVVTIDPLRAREQQCTADTNEGLSQAVDYLHQAANAIRLERQEALLNGGASSNESLEATVQ